ncbi:hypothetical protein Avbf_09167 [Armadillidium vulgare]|nr:hypothetical protein Avbf_09167 [Armadillidium vulgare]
MNLLVVLVLICITGSCQNLRL